VRRVPACLQADTIFKLLNRKWPWASGANEGRHRKILVIDPSEAGRFNDLVWETDIGECLKSMQWKIRVRKDAEAASSHPMLYRRCSFAN